MMPGDSNETRLAEIVAQCMGELLTELKVQAERLTGARQPPPAGEAIAAFCGFGNNELRGSFTLLGPSKLFARLHPIPPTPSPRDLTDWACELANQSVGRFRNRMFAYGVRLAPSLPQSALAEQLMLSSSLHQPARTPIAFSIDGMVLEGWFDVEIQPSFRLAEKPSEEEAIVLNEGGMLIF
jgi:hypothetical protein